MGMISELLKEVNKNEVNSMNYIKELNAFREWAMLNSPSTGVVSSWYTLMSLNNINGERWFTVPHRTLQIMTGLSKGGVEKARHRLIQLGLIQYSKGNYNQAGSYHMIPLSSDDTRELGIFERYLNNQG